MAVVSLPVLCKCLANSSSSIILNSVIGKIGIETHNINHISSSEQCDVKESKYCKPWFDLLCEDTKQVSNLRHLLCSKRTFQYICCGIRIARRGESAIATRIRHSVVTK